MKKATRRILCGALSLALAGTLATEQVLRLSAESKKLSTTAETSVSFKDVTGEFDTSALRESNFNSQVLQNTSTPTYETRSVIVTLTGDSLSDAAENGSVNEFAETFTGRKLASDIRKQQEAFLKKLSQAGISYTLDRTYDTLLNGVAIEINTKHVKAIKEMSGVESAVITTTYAAPKTAQTTASQEVFNTTSVYGTGIYDSTDYTDVAGSGIGDYGEGMVVAVLDTGLDYTHNAFQRSPQNPAWTETDVEKFFTGDVELKAAQRSGSLSAKDVYVSAKVPFAYDYADDDPDVYPSYSNHGTHVAGIIGGYDESGYTDKDGNIVWNDTDGDGVKDDNESLVTFRGVVPDAQLVICKVFTDDLDDPELGGATPVDIIAALEDCVTIGVDVINMSLGTSCGFTTTDDGDSEGKMLNDVYDKIKKAGISLVCAASNDYSAGYGGAYGTNLTDNPDSGTVGSPSTFAAALSVASISGQESPYMVATSGDEESFVFYEESRDENGNPYDFAEDMLALKPSGEFEYVVIPGKGLAADYSLNIKNLLRDNNGVSRGRIALIQRGDSTFKEKVELAMEMGAVGVIVYNNVSGIIRMNLGEIENPVPSVSIDMDAGSALISAATNRVGTVKISLDTTAGPFMSEFSSWGPTHDLKLKPEITAHGGEITSTVPGGYGEQSGTSMASPNMAGVMAIVRSYIEKNLTSLVVDGDGDIDSVLVNRLANQLMMSTATLVRDSAGRPYSPRKQGAGLGSLANVINNTSAYLYTNSEANDYRPKLELGDNPEMDENRTYDNLDFSVKNFGNKALTFKTNQLVFTETVSKNGLTVAEQAYMLSPDSVVWTVNGQPVTEITVPAGESVDIHVSITLSDEDVEYYKNFSNGMYMEGFLQLQSVEANGDQCDLSIPFLGFYGDWYGSPMLDHTAYDVAKDAQDASKTDEEKIQASVWATQPYSTYYNEKYILPMGGYVYLLDENDEPMYANEEYAAISRFNNYYGEGEAENYLTSTAIKAVYAGLLRNARVVKYKMYNVQTGEEIISDGLINRVGKAYSGGGSAVPANVELNISPEEYGLLGNGQYRMDFEFFATKPEDGETAPEENTYSFTFTVDYEAPILEDVRVRYYNYKDGTKEKQRIYLDVDVYDNHYAQSMMLCYPEEKWSEEAQDTETVLQLATEYPTPIRKPNKNGTTTVSIEITDIYEQYGDTLYLQIDDYAVNSCLYLLNLNESQANVLPDEEDYALAAGEESIELGLYETHKVKLVYDGDADLSNFTWEAVDTSIAAVKNGEIVGLSAGTTTVKVKNRKGAEKVINVTVTADKKASLAEYPFISFGLIKTDTLSLAKASGTVPVNAGQEFQLTIEKDPWYHPKALNIVWESLNPEVATVDQNGNVKTLKKGVAIITATVAEAKLYTTSVTLNVQNEFRVSNYTLQDYNGVGYNEGNPADGTDVLVIPDDLNIMYIGEEAFSENNNIRRIVIPASVTQINERAFERCTALEEVYFVSMEHREKDDGSVDMTIDWSDLSLVESQAFYACPKLKKVDLSNVKVITIADNCFANCTALEEVLDMPSIGTMHHQAFANCTSLKSVDISGLFVAGNYVFQNCTGIRSITTGKFTTIGNYMFYGCTGLGSSLTLNASKIGEGAFMNCTKLPKVTLKSPTGEALKFDIGAYAFANCGINRTSGSFAFDFGNETVRTLGNNAFAKVAVTFDELGRIRVTVLDGTVLSEIAINDSFELTALQKGGLAFNNVKVTVAGGERYSVDPNNENVILATVKGADNNSYKTVALVNTSATGSYTVPADVTAIGGYAFANSALTSVTLHSGVTTIGEGAFANSKISTLNFAGAAIDTIPARAFYGAKITKMELSDTVETVGDFAFAGSTITEFSAPALVKIGNYAFFDCSMLTKVTLVDSITGIGDYAFANCTTLESVTLPAIKLATENLPKTIGSYAFYGAEKLKNVTFGAGSETTGDYTFLGTSVQNVSLGNSMKEIGEAAFAECGSLASLTLPQTLTKIGAFAFADCRNLATVNLGNVKEYGAFAFYNAGVTTLDLTSATDIGYGAFASSEQLLWLPLDYSEDNLEDLDDCAINFGGMLYYIYVDGERTASYTNTTLNLPAAKNVGAFAFFNGGMEAVTLSESVKAIGEGAFASAENLVSFAIGTAKENDGFVVIDNVLYRYIGDKAAKEYEIVCYPAARVTAANADGKKVYAIEDGTLNVQSYAFYGLNSGAIDEVLLPYSVNSIGDSAFYASGIKAYTFESIEAPRLETVYREEITLLIEAAADLEQAAAYYKGYYNANFETEVFNYSKFGREKSALVLNYPVNGKGYDNFLYDLYFGTKNQMKIEKTDTTRECLVRISTLKTVEQINAWLNVNKTDETAKAEVASFASEVQAVRLLYNNAMADATQSQFITEEDTATLLAVEEALRNVKTHFNIVTKIKEITVASSSTHKSTYLVGETFDMTGLIVNVVYEDGSIVTVDSSELTLVTTTALGTYDRVVEVSYFDGNTGKRCTIGVTVQKETTNTPDTDSSVSGSDSESENEGLPTGAIVAIVVVGVLIVAAAAVSPFLIKRFGKKAPQTQAKNETAEALTEAEETPVEAVVEETKDEE